MLSRRNFVMGLGAAGAATGSWLAARGRENAVWSLLEPTLEAQSATGPGAAAAAPLILSSNENPTGPSKAVLDAVRAAFGPAGAEPGRYSSAGGALIDALAKQHNVKPENIVLRSEERRVGKECRS